MAIEVKKAQQLTISFPMGDFTDSLLQEQLLLLGMPQTLASEPYDRVGLVLEWYQHHKALFTETRFGGDATTYELVLSHTRQISESVIRELESYQERGLITGFRLEERP